jgi:Tol biopolymer transport system component
MHRMFMLVVALAKSHQNAEKAFMVFVNRCMQWPRPTLPRNEGLRYRGRLGAVLASDSITDRGRRRVMRALSDRQWRRSAALAAGSLAVAAAAALPAGAAMPGVNGRISLARFEPDGSEQLWVAKSDLTNAVKLTTGPSSSVFSDWRPDGQRIVLDSDRATTSEEDFHVDVYTMKPDGTDVVRLTDVGFNGEPAYSPDGSQIVFESDRGDFPAQEGIYLMKADGSDLRRVTTTPAGWIDAAPEVSPDGTRIAFERQAYRHIGRGKARDEAGATSVIYVVDADGSNLQRLTPWGVQADDVDWAPDGSKLVFQSENHHSGNNADLYVVDADGSNLTRITNNPPTSHFGNGTEAVRELATDPVWSPDGTKIMFVQVSGLVDATVRHLYTVNPDGTGLTLVSATVLGVDQPDWGSAP